MASIDKKNKFEVRKVDTENGIEVEIQFGQDKIRIPKSQLKEFIRLLENMVLQNKFN